MTCNRCGGEMKPDGLVFEPVTLRFVDFPGETPGEGSTCVQGNSDRLVRCWKCHECGHSVEIKGEVEG